MESDTDWMEMTMYDIEKTQDSRQKLIIEVCGVEVKCEDLLLFIVISDSKWTVFGFWTY